MDDSTRDIIDQAICDIEASKSRDVIEADDLKEDYHRGAYRSHGLTKRQCEDRLQRFQGKVLGHEAALSVLYKLVAADDQEKEADATMARLRKTVDRPQS